MSGTHHTAKTSTEPHHSNHLVSGKTVKLNCQTVPETSGNASEGLTVVSMDRAQCDPIKSKSITKNRNHFAIDPIEEQPSAIFDNTARNEFSTVSRTRCKWDPHNCRNNYMWTKSLDNRSETEFLTVSMTRNDIAAPTFFSHRRQLAQ